MSKTSGVREIDLSCKACKGTGKGYILHTGKPTEVVKCWHCDYPKLEIEKKAK